MKYVVFAVITAAVYALGLWTGVAWTISRSNADNAAVCRRVDVLDDALVTILNRSFKALPSNPYYKQHPDSLSKALQSTQAAIDDLNRARC